MGHWTN